MKQRRFGKVEELFRQACKHEPAKRAAFLDKACGDDAELRAQVEALLAADETQVGFLAESGMGERAAKQAAGALADKGSEPQKHHKTIGNYRILDLLGEGGMGLVYLAEQTEPIRRKVALKLIKLGMDTERVLARFDAERQAIALMDHPNIARVFDAGSTDSGRPYFVMECVRGIPITEHCDRERLSIGERLDLFMQVCDGVQHAHQKGIIHRDIKPTNILVEYVGDKATPKIIDFGVAKATAQRLTERTLFTEQGQLVGTPEYMSPEQAEMSAQDIDTRSDIYALGVLLYELLTGMLPFDPQTLREAGFGEIQRIIRESQPPKPSTKLGSLHSGDQERRRDAEAPTSDTPALVPATDGVTSTTTAADIAHKRRTELRVLAQELRGDLDWIVMKCLEKERTRRYATASDLLQDVERHLKHQPVEAGPPSAMYRVRKFVRRNRLLVGATGTVAAVLIIATIGMSVLAAWALRERDRAEIESANAEVMYDFVTEALISSDPHEGGRQDLRVVDALHQAFGRLDDGELEDLPEAEAGLRLTIARILNGNGFQEEALPIAEKALEIYERLYEGNHPDVAAAMHCVTVCLRALSRSEEALPICESALEMRKRLYPGDHESVAESLNEMGLCLKDRNQFSDALDNYKAALEMRQRLFPGDHESVAESLNNVALCLKQTASPADPSPLEEARDKYEEALAMCRRLNPDGSPETATTLNNLAVCHKTLGDAEGALPLYEESLEMRQRLFKGDHPLVAASLNNVAGCLMRLAQSEEEPLPWYEEALDRYEKALEMQGRLYADGHADLADSLLNVASAMRLLNRLEDAVVRYEQALEMYQRFLPTDDPKLVPPRRGLCRAFSKLNRYPEAEFCLRGAIEQCERDESTRQRYWRSVVGDYARLYDAWYAAEPDGGYDAKAAEWRAKLTQTDS